MKNVIPKWGKCKSGVFNPLNKSKYKGLYPIIFRSSLELSFMQLCDSSSSIKEWSSETYIVDYISPKDNRKHRYYPDFLIKVEKEDSKLETIIIEIKPSTQTKKPKKPKRITSSSISNYNKNLMVWAINNAKWGAAKKVAENLNYKFIILTEKWLESNKF